MKFSNDDLQFDGEMPFYDEHPELFEVRVYQQSKKRFFAGVAFILVVILDIIWHFVN